MATFAAVTAVVGSVVASSPGQPADGMASLRIENAAARVVVIPERRANIAVSIKQAAKGPKLTTRQIGPTLVIEGQGGQRRGWLFGKRGPLTCDGAATRDLPIITAHVPVNARVSASGAVYGEIGPSSSLALATDGCGDWRIGDVSGQLEVNTAGSGAVHAGAAQVAKAKIVGSGALALDRVERQLDVEVEGSGQVRAARSDGPLTVKLAGSGDVTVDAGHAPTATIAIEGSGDVRHNGTVGKLVADVKGSGDVDAREVQGAVQSTVAGGGDVRYGRPLKGRL